MLKNDHPKRPAQPMDPVKMYQLKQVQDAGVGLTVAGTLMSLAVGLPVWYAGDNGNFGYKEANRAATEAGVVLTFAGAGIGSAGIIMAAVGGGLYNKAKKNQNMYLTLNTDANGIGLGLTF